MPENVIKTVKIQKIIDESIGVKTIYFKMSDAETPEPGQFVMIWVPGVDEIPMSLSDFDDKGNWAITVKKVGECTKAIHDLKEGDYIGVRGPLGNYFKSPEDNSKKIILVGGRLGTAALKSLATKLNDSKIKFKLIFGLIEIDHAIFVKDFLNYDHNNSDINLCLEFEDENVEGITVEKFYDSKHFKFPHERLEGLINECPKEDLSKLIVYACGPEKMIYKVFQICEKYSIELQASLERIMRCGCGLCGLCAIDPLGLLVCKDGPIFSSKELRKMGDFGKYRRDFTGKKITLN